MSSYLSLRSSATASYSMRIPVIHVIKRILYVCGCVSCLTGVLLLCSLWTDTCNQRLLVNSLSFLKKSLRDLLKEVKLLQHDLIWHRASTCMLE